MLEIKENKLTATQSITKADTVIKLTLKDTPIDANTQLYALVTLGNKTVKTLPFVAENDYYKARLVVTEEEYPYLYNSMICVAFVGIRTEYHTNTVSLKFDTKQIAQSVKVAASKDIQQIRTEIAKLTALVNTVLNTKVVYETNLNVKQENIQPGMIPMAINNEGLCVFQFPFVDIIKEINGQTTVNNAIIITAKDIPIGTTNVELAIKAQTEAIKKLNESLGVVSNQLKSVVKKVAEVETALIQHTDSSII